MLVCGTPFAETKVKMERSTGSAGNSDSWRQKNAMGGNYVKTQNSVSSRITQAMSLRA
jgi:hypothetical protein